MAKLALDAGKLVVGGEPNTLGLKSTDEVGFRLLRKMSYVKKTDLSNALNETYEAQAFANVKKFTSGANGWNYSTFAAWYEGVNHEAFQLGHAWQDIAPSFNSENPKGTNQLSDTVDLNRDNHALEVIRDGLLAKEKVMVAYGGDHLPRLLLALKSNLTSIYQPIVKCIETPSFNGNAFPASLRSQ